MSCSYPIRLETTGLKKDSYYGTSPTSEEPLDYFQRFEDSLGKTAVVVPDSFGLVVGWLLLPLFLQAISALYNGVANNKDSEG
jgi:3-hydroxyacyl-CoA dehydrogenase